MFTDFNSTAVHGSYMEYLKQFPERAPHEGKTFQCGETIIISTDNCLGEHYKYQNPLDPCCILFYFEVQIRSKTSVEQILGIDVGYQVVDSIVANKPYQMDNKVFLSCKNSRVVQGDSFVNWQIRPGIKSNDRVGVILDRSNNRVIFTLNGNITGTPITISTMDNAFPSIVLYSKDVETVVICGFKKKFAFDIDSYFAETIQRHWYQLADRYSVSDQDPRNCYIVKHLATLGLYKTMLSTATETACITDLELRRDFIQGIFYREAESQLKRPMEKIVVLTVIEDFI
ncbi:hypothetical protein ACOME3_007750 [Neoechinorhynchus agilis]